MSDIRQKTRQFNFRLSPEIAGDFEDYCNERGITFTSFIDSAIRKALGKPVPLPAEFLGQSSTPSVPVAEASSQKLETLEERLARVEAELGKWVA